MSDIVLKTIIAEAGGDPAGMAAVAHVIANRAREWGMTPEQVVKQPGQFEGYSNPGSGSKAAQKDAKVLARAEQVWSGVTSGAIPDPTNGGLSFRAASASKGMAAPNGKVNIGGNVFAKGSGSPQTALAAIDAVAPPNPQQRPPALAYGNDKVRAITVNPDGTPDMVSGLNAKFPGLSFTQSPKTAEAITGMSLPAPKAPGMIAPGNIDLSSRPVYFGNDGTYGTERSFSIGTDKGEVLIPQIVNGKLVSQAEAIKHYQQTGENMGTFASPDAADAYAEKTHNRDQGLGNMPVPMPGRPAALSVPSVPQSLISHPVQTVRIDPMTGNPVGAKNTPDLQTALNTLAAKRAQIIVPQAPIKSTPNQPAPPNVTFTGNGFNAPPTPFQQANAAQVMAGLPFGIGTAATGLGNAYNAVANLFGPQSPAQPTATASIIAPVPMPGRPSFPTSPGKDIIVNKPYVPPASPSRIDTTNPLDVTRLGLTNDPFKAPAVRAIERVTNQPTQTYTTKQMQVSNPDYLKYIAAQKADPIAAGPGSFADLQSSLTIAPKAPPKTITQTIRVPAPTIPVRAPAAFPLTSFKTVNPMSQVGPNIASHFNTSPAGHLYQLATGEPVQGGLFGMLFGGGNQSAPASNPGATTAPGVWGNPVAEAAANNPSGFSNPSASYWDKSIGGWSNQ